MSESRSEPEPRRLPADQTPLPTMVPTGVDARFVDVWCAFLDRLATDAEAALAAAIAYGELDQEARNVWLEALDQDIGRIGVPRIAVYAPLLAVETDPARRSRITAAIGPVPKAAAPRTRPRAFTGTIDAETRVAVIVAPLYLDFVRVLACGYHPGERFDWVRHDPIVEDSQAPNGKTRVGEASVDPAPLKAVVDELALTVVAHRRGGTPVPEALTVFADLFGPSASVVSSWPEVR